jgi:hypothetical protein
MIFVAILDTLDGVELEMEEKGQSLELKTELSGDNGLALTPR